MCVRGGSPPPMSAWKPPRSTKPAPEDSSSSYDSYESLQKKHRNLSPTNTADKSNRKTHRRADRERKKPYKRGSDDRGFDSGVEDKDRGVGGGKNRSKKRIKDNEVSSLVFYIK